MPIGTLLAYWDFEDGPGSGMARDQSGNDHTGILEGLSPSNAWVTGHTGRGLEFPSPPANKSAGVRIARTPDIENLRAFTIGAWFKRGGASTGVLVSRQIGSSNDEVFYLGCYQSNLVAYIPTSDQGAVSGASGAGAAPVGKWTHAAATYDGTWLRLYADGLEVAAGQYVDRLRSSTTPVYIGNNKNTTYEEPFEGIIDDVVIYSSALSPAKIKLLVSGVSPKTIM
ncbi:MAG TPA: LamG domain-containing protein [Polyangia bacterium]